MMMQSAQDDHKALHKALIKVSDLTQYMLCPRLVYFSARGYEQPKIVEGKEGSAIKHILLKELGFNLHKVYEIDDEGGDKAGNAEEAVNRAIADIVDGVEWIYRDELKDVEEALFEHVKTDFVHSIGKNSEWLGKLRAGNTTLAELERSYGYEREHTVVSEKLSLIGSVDKLIKREGEVIPCVIKTGRAPEYGIWRSDRMQLAAYAMLLEEEFGTTVERGFVEYIRTAEIRESHIRKKDRALAIQTLKRVKRVKEGIFPEKGENAPCDNCAFIERCETKKTLLSKLLGK
jgi:CRISPR-associated exonuclease Cas4